MGWLIGIGLFFFMIWLMIISPTFRYIVLLIGAGIGIWIYNNNEENKKQQAQRDIENYRAAQAQAAYDAKARTLLRPDDLLFSNVTLKKEFSDEWSLTGPVTNRGSYELSWVRFDVTMQDCSSECVTIGESDAIAHVPVPAGQARAFTATAHFSGGTSMRHIMKAQWRGTVESISPAAAHRRPASLTLSPRQAAAFLGIGKTKLL
jgi:hypothetical protein